jgi:hypothetical protein
MRHAQDPVRQFAKVPAPGSAFAHLHVKPLQSSNTLHSLTQESSNPRGKLQGHATTSNGLRP